MSRACYAGDLEAADLIVAQPIGLRLLSTGGEPEPATIPAKGLRVTLVREEHPFDPERVCFKASGVPNFYDLHRATVVKVAG